MLGLAVQADLLALRYYRSERIGNVLIKGCGKGSVSLTFYLARSERVSDASKSLWVACGQLAETTCGFRGVLLCLHCASVHGFKDFRKEQAVSGRAGL